MWKSLRSLQLSLLQPPVTRCGAVPPLASVNGFISFSGPQAALLVLFTIASACFRPWTLEGRPNLAHPFLQLLLADDRVFVVFFFFQILYCSNTELYCYFVFGTADDAWKCKFTVFLRSGFCLNLAGL